MTVPVPAGAARRENTESDASPAAQLEAPHERVPAILRQDRPRARTRLPPSG